MRISKVAVPLAAIATLLAVAKGDGPEKHVIQSLTDDLPFDENGKLSSFQLLVPEGTGCFEMMNSQIPVEEQDMFDRGVVAGQAARELFGAVGFGHRPSPRSLDDCAAVYLERGVDKSLVGAVMPHLRFNSNTKEKFQEWFVQSCLKTEACFLNYHSRSYSLRVFWIDLWAGGKASHRYDIAYGNENTQCMQTYLGHEFEFRDGQTDEVLYRHKIEYATILSLGESPHYRVGGRNFTREVETTLRREWQKHHRVKRTFSPVGFKKGRLPDDVFASMGALYYNNAAFKVREEWTGKGVFVNWWETDAFFIQVPWRLRNLYQKRLLELVEAWTGVRLEETSMYGFRQYESGARLLTHVDREATHAASLIVNVAQGNLSEPWPVEIHDHADRLHEITMEPGDIVYYESAKCLHARNRPLKGEGAYYVNLFTHYRPIGDPRWFQKEEGPEPLMDVGECHVVEGSTEEGMGTVTCENADIGPYLSPSMFTASSADDLFSWWEKVGPSPVGQPEEIKANSLMDEL